MSEFQLDCDTRYEIYKKANEIYEAKLKENIIEAHDHLFEEFQNFVRSMWDDIYLCDDGQYDYPEYFHHDDDITDEEKQNWSDLCDDVHEATCFSEIKHPFQDEAFSRWSYVNRGSLHLTESYEELKYNHYRGHIYNADIWGGLWHGEATDVRVVFCDCIKTVLQEHHPEMDIDTAMRYFLRDDTCIDEVYDWAQGAWKELPETVDELIQEAKQEA